jgi:hypothetical protein
MCLQNVGLLIKRFVMIIYFLIFLQFLDFHSDGQLSLTGEKTGNPEVCIGIRY